MKFFFPFLLFFSLTASNAFAWDSIVDDTSSVPASQATDSTVNPFDETTIARAQQDARDAEQYWVDFWKHLNMSLPNPKLSIPRAEENKNEAWIMAGNVSSTIKWIVDVARAIGGTIGITSSDKKYMIEGIVIQAQSALLSAGYQLNNIHIDYEATTRNLQAVLNNPKTGTLVWIGHGDVGGIFDVKSQPIDWKYIRNMALKVLKDKGIYKSPTSYPEGSRMRKAMKHISDRAHFGLNYMYSHSCLTMQEPLFGQHFVKKGGRYEGYIAKKLAYVVALTPAMSADSNIEIPDVHTLMLVPEVKGKKVAKAEELLVKAGFTAKIVEDWEDTNKAGEVYSQMPYEGTILDKNIGSKEVTLYVYREGQATSGSGEGNGSSSNDNNKFLVWLNIFGNGGRVHAGLTDTYKRDKKYADEFLAGISQEYMKKRILSESRFPTIKEAKAAACNIISNPRIQRSSTWGALQIGTLGGQTVYIDGLDCPINNN